VKTLWRRTTFAWTVGSIDCRSWHCTKRAGGSGLVASIPGRTHSYDCTVASAQTTWMPRVMSGTGDENSYRVDQSPFFVSKLSQQKVRQYQLYITIPR
jgi:hypothetical protein